MVQDIYPQPKTNNEKTYNVCVFCFVCSIQFLSHVWRFVKPSTVAPRLPCPSPTPGAYSNSCPSSWWCHQTISSSAIPFSSCLQSFSVLGSFPMSPLFTSGGQSIGVSSSTSVLPMNIQDWFPWGWNGWISLQSKGHSRIFSNITAQKHQFFGAFGVQLSHPWSIQMDDYWKNNRLNKTDICWQSNVSAF